MIRNALKASALALLLFLIAARNRLSPGHFRNGFRLRNAPVFSSSFSGAVKSALLVFLLPVPCLRRQRVQLLTDEELEVIYFILKEVASGSWADYQEATKQFARFHEKATAAEKNGKLDDVLYPSGSYYARAKHGERLILG